MEIESQKLPHNGNAKKLSASSALADAVRDQVFRSLYMGEGNLLSKATRPLGFTQGRGDVRTQHAFSSKPKRYLRIAEVREITGLATSTLYRYLKHQLFPAPVELGPNCVGWDEGVVAEWCRTRKPRNRTQRG